MTVPRGTEAKFTRYLKLLTEWQQRLNLVSPSSLAVARERHIGDSLQLIDHVPAHSRSGTWVDIGAGAGFPGMVAAIVLPELRVHLIEARAKKCRFLEAVAADLDLGDRVTVHPKRAETLQGLKADIISARACAELSKLFDWGRNFQAKDSLWLLPKGRSYAAELDAASREFHFEHEAVPSRTDPEARIILARRVRRRAERRGRRTDK